MADVIYAGEGILSVVASLQQGLVTKFAGAGSLIPVTSVPQISFGFPGIPFPQHGAGLTSTVQSYLYPGAVLPLHALPLSVLSYTNAFPGIPVPQHLAGQTTTVQSYLYPGAAQPLVSLPIPILVFANLAGLARFTGTGSLSALAAVSPPGARNETLSGTGSLRASSLLHLAGPAKFSGSGLLSVATTFNASARATFNGAGGLVQFDLSNNIHARIGAVGEFPLGQEASLLLSLTQFAKFNGAGSLSVNLASGSKRLSSVFSGTGSLTVDTIWNQNTPVTFHGLGRLCVQMQVFKGSVGRVSNVEEVGPGITEPALA